MNPQFDKYVAYRPAIGNTITDPITKRKYILLKVIGTSGFDFVYKASYYRLTSSINRRLLPSGYTTIKYLRKDSPGGSNLIPRTRVRYRLMDLNPNLINIEHYCIRSLKDGNCVTLPHMSEGSIRYILSTRFHYGLPEDCIAIVLKEALSGLLDVHNSRRVHKTFSASDIFVNYKSRPVSTVQIKLAHAETVYESNLETPLVNDFVGDKQGNLYRGQSSVPPLTIMSEWAAAPEVFYGKYDDSDSDDEYRNPAYPKEPDESFYSDKSDIWLVGIAALELAYGNIRVSHRSEFEAMIKKIKRTKKLPHKLEYLLEEINEEEKGGKMKKVMGYFKDKMNLTKKKRERVFSDDFEEFVLDCLSRRASKRPTVEELLQRPFFRNARDLKWFQRCVLHAKNPMTDADAADD